MNLQRAAHRLEADLDEDAGRVLDVVARRLDQPRRLPQLRQHAAGPFGQRRVVNSTCAGEARRQDVGVVAADCAPRSGPASSSNIRRRMFAATIGCSSRFDGASDRVEIDVLRAGARSPRARGVLLDRLRLKSSRRSSCVCTPSSVASVG